MRIIRDSYLERLFKFDYDTNQNGILDKDEIDERTSIDRELQQKQCTIFKYREGMDILQFAEMNLDYFREYLLLNDKEYKDGRQILEGDKFIPTDEKRQTCDDDTNSSLVEQGRYAIKKYSQDTPTMQTYHVCDCVAVTIYDKETKTGFMAHFDLFQTTEKLDEILDSANFNPDTSEVRIIGGHTNNSEPKIEIIENAINKHNLKIVEYDILGDNCQRSIQLDLKTGELFDYNETEPFYHIRDFDEKYGTFLISDDKINSDPWRFMNPSIII